MATLPDIKIRKLQGNGTIKIVVTKEFKFRLAIAMALFKAGAWIIGVGCEHEEPPEDDDLSGVSPPSHLVPKSTGFVDYS